MKIKVNTNEFKKACDFVSRALAVRPAVEVYGAIHAAASNNAVTLSAFDGIMMNKYQIPCEVEQEGEANIRAEKLRAVVSHIEEETIEIESGETGAVLRYGKNTCRIPVVTGTFPEETTEENICQVKYDADELRKALDGVAYCVSLEETRPIFTGVYLEIADTETHLVALDGFRLAYRRIACQKDITRTETVKAVVPRKGVSEIINVISRANGGEVNLNIGDRTTSICVDNMKSTCVMLSGEYADFRKLLPAGFGTELKAGKEKIMDMFERVQIFTTNKSYCKLAITDGEMTVTVSEEAGDITENADIEKIGADLEIGVNSKYVTDALKHVSTDEVGIKMTTQTGPIIFSDTNGAEINLILPTRIIR